MHARDFLHLPAMHRFLRPALAATTVLVCTAVFADEKRAQTSDVGNPVKGAKDLIQKQEPFRVVPERYLKATTESTRIVVHLASQRLQLMVGEEACIDAPISSGKRTAPTPVGTFTVLEKIKGHQSGNYGSFVDKRERVIRSGVSMKLDAAPAGSHYVSLPMPYFCRFTDTGFGIYGGILPGYPAAHGSIRVPIEMMKFIHDKVRIGTPIEIRED